MRIPFPARVNPRIGFMVAMFVAVAEVAEGTNPLFALLAGTFIMLSVVAFNIVGGFSYPSGAFIAAFSLLDFTLAQFVKIALLEPADRNLRAPISTAGAYTVGMAGILVAGWMSRRFLLRKPILKFEERDLPNLPMTAIGLFIIGVAADLVIAQYGTNEGGGVESGTVFSALSHFNQFVSLAILVGTFYIIRVSGGRKSMTLYTAAAIGYISLMGLIAASKQGMLTGLVAYLLVCANLKYKFKPMQVGILAGVGLLFALVLIPWSQWGRNFTNGVPLVDRAQIAFALLTDPKTYTDIYDNSNVDPNAEERFMSGLHYFDRPHGLLDRWALVAMDDGLIDIASRNGPVGAEQLKLGILNVLPRFIYSSKSIQATGNLFAHDLGYLGDEDTTTGISFSLIGTGFYEMSWVGLLAALPVMMFFTFLISDSLMGRVDLNPWAILYTLLFLHTAPEGAIDGLPSQQFYYPLIFIVTVWFSKHGAPFIATLVGRSRAADLAVRANPVAEAVIEQHLPAAS